MNKTLIAVYTLAAAFALAAPNADAAGRVKARGGVQNAEGGITGGSASAARGPNGGAAARGRAQLTERVRPCQYGARSLNFCSLPVEVRASSSRSSTEVGHL